MCAEYPFLDHRLSLQDRVEDLVGRLTLEEKAGLVPSRQIGIERLGISEWHVGCEIARGYVGRTPKEPSTVLPQPIGMSAMFDPELIEELGELAGNETRVYYQKEKKGKLMLFGPTVDMERDPRWGRTEEAYGEDPYLTGRMSSAFARGLKGSDPFYVRTVPGLKHFCANNNERDRISCSANIDPRTKHEYYYKAFRPAILEGAALSVMASYNELSGVPALLNPDLRTVLKDSWGLSFVMSDGGDFSGNVTDHHYVNDHAESIALAIKAGADIMLDDAELVRWSVLEAVKRGLLTEQELDESIKRILAVRFRLGEFDPKESNPYADIPDHIVDCEKHRELNRRAAKEQVILLKNNGLLPLEQGKVKKAAIIGPLADKNYMDWYCGYSSYNISVAEGIRRLLGAEKTEYDSAYDIVTLKSCLNQKYLSVKEDGSVIADRDTAGDAEAFEFHDWDFGSQNLLSVKNRRYLREENGITATGENTYGWIVKEWLKIREYPKAKGIGGDTVMIDTWNDLSVAVDPKGRLITGSSPGAASDRLFYKETVSDGVERAVCLAKECDVAVVCVGNDPMQVGRECYDRPDITLARHQSELIRAVYEANPNTIVLVVSSYPYALNWEDKNIPAIVYTTHAGPELGTAVADVLFGRYNPAGRTPLTWYRSALELPDIMDYDIIKNNMTYQYYLGDPLYPFGYGLSYASFAYHNLIIHEQEAVQVMTTGCYAHDLTVLRLSLDVTNISDTDGDEVVQLYVRPEVSRVKRPLKTLCGFKRVHIKAGMRVTVFFDVKAEDIEFYDVTREKFCVEDGDYTFMAGANSRDIFLTRTVHITGEVIPARKLSEWTPAILYDDKSGVRMLFSKELNRYYLTTSGMTARFIKFAGVDMGGAGTVCITAATAAGKAAVTLHIDSIKNEPSGRLELPITGGPGIFRTFSTIITPAEGVHDLYFVPEHDLSILDIKLE